MPAGASSTLRLALVGCGGVTREKHMPALRRVRGVRVVAVADVDAERRERVGREFGVPILLPGIEEVLALEEVDAVGIALPPAIHEEASLAAIAASRHVWIDKPLALSVEACRAIIEASTASPRVVMTGFHMRWHRLVREMKAIVESGRLGRIESIRSVWNSPRRDHDIPAWRVRRETGGGALMEIGVHHFDLWRFLLGREVRDVFAVSRDGVRDDENAVVVATLDDGVLATAVLSERTGHEIEIEICGSEGRLRAGCLSFDGLEWLGVREAPGMIRPRARRAVHLLRELPGGLVSMPRGGDYRESYRASWQAFVDAARGLAAPSCGPAEGLRAVEIALAAFESRRERRPALVASGRMSG